MPNNKPYIIIVEYWIREQVSKQYESGGSYLDNVQVLKETIKHEVVTWEEQIEVFKKFYHDNNKLRYCNGYYYKFTEKEFVDAYSEFLKTYDTIENYYGNGVVD